jgi:hypothetical protein
MMAGIPVLLRWPESQRVDDNRSVRFETESTGPEPLSFQWRFNGLSIAGETNTSLFFPNLTTNQNGSILYWLPIQRDAAFRSRFNSL